MRVKIGPFRHLRRPDIPSRNAAGRAKRCGNETLQTPMGCLDATAILAYILASVIPLSQHPPLVRHGDCFGILRRSQRARSTQICIGVPVVRVRRL